MANKLSLSSKRGLLVRTISSVVFIGIVLPCTLFGDWSFLIMIAFISIIGCYEIIHAPGNHRYPIYLQAIVYFFTLSFIFWTFIKNSIVDNLLLYNGIYLNQLFVSILGIILYALVLFLVAIFDSKIQLQDVTYLFTLGIIFALGMQGMLFLRLFPSSTGAVNSAIADREFLVSLNGKSIMVTPKMYFYEYNRAFNLYQGFTSCILMCFVFVGTFISDVGAYLFGMFFGKHHMSPRISPHKTWEGFFGGMIVSIIFSLGGAAILEYVFNIPVVPGLIQFRYSPLLKDLGIFNGQAWPFIVMIALFMPIVGNIGGFLFSLIKRHYGIKDYGKIMPGHGGVIDRFDAVMINSIIISIIVLMTSKGWNLSI